MFKTFQTSAKTLSCVAAALTFGCASASPVADMTGTAAIAVINAPADGTCVQVDVVGPQTVDRFFDVAVGASTTFHLGGLPVGTDTFTANAFSGPCSMVNAMSIPNWVSDPVVKVVSTQPAVSVALAMKRNGNANVSVDFPTGPDAGPDAQACAAPGISCGGVCTSIQSDPNNCGSCGVVCVPPPHAVSSVCMGGACLASACASGFADCNGQQADGCEADLLTNVNNCGTCANVCPPRANAVSVCTSGMCTLACSAGFANCDGNATNGCEINLQSDVNNCGSCGKKCMTACVMGACNP